ncbi:MAG: metallophosphoesterase [Agromyces sp.]
MRGLVSTALVAGAGVLAWASLVERTRFVVREHAVPVLPAGSPSIRVLHLSDLHMAPWQRKKQRWVASLAELQPDVVVVTGDALGHRDGLVGLERALAPFAGIPGVVVHGSNDYFAPHLKNPLRYLLGPSRISERLRPVDTEGLNRLYRRLGWQDLNNRSERFDVNGVSLGRVGVDDPHLERDDLDLALDALDALDPVAAVIGVTHAPYRRVLDAFTHAGSAITFAGHTHGGQVCLPRALGGALVTNCDLPRAQASGVSLWSIGADASALHVSAGIGTSIYAPVRLFCPPEACIVTLGEVSP